jgi:hypothetical protein
VSAPVLVSFQSFSLAIPCRNISTRNQNGDGESGQAGFDQQLQIIVVRLVDEKRSVEAAKLRIDDRE